MTNKPKNKRNKFFILSILFIALLAFGAFSTRAEAARTSGFWNTVGSYMKTIFPEGKNILINGTDKYVNFGFTSGSSGYGIRDNSGTMEFKSSGGSWAAFGSGGGGGGSGGGWSTTTNDLALYPTNTNHVVIVGGNATTTTGNIFEVIGSTLMDALTASGLFTANSGFVSQASSTVVGDFTIASSSTSLLHGDISLNRLTIGSPLTIPEGLNPQLYLPMVADQNILIDGSTNNRTVDTGVMRFLHTPAIENTRSVTYVIDANSLPNTHATVVEFSATGLAAGEQGIGHDVQINTADSTGGFVAALEVSKTGSGSAEAQGLRVGSGVLPIVQKTGTFGNVEQAWSYNGAYTDQTATFNSGASDSTLFGANGDYIYVGMAAQFDAISVVLNTAASNPGIKPTFEFSAGTGSWTAFSPSDDTLGFRNDALIWWDTADLTGWTTDTVNGVGSKYWIRIARTQASLTTPPIEDTIQVQTSTRYDWDENGDLEVNNINLAGSGTGAWTGTFDGQEGSYYLNASNLTNFGSPFFTFFSATNTSALSEGSNLYYTDARVNTLLNASSTLSIPLCSSGQILEWNGSRWACGADDTGAGGSSLHADGGSFVYPLDGQYHAAPYYTATSTTATSTFSGDIKIGSGTSDNMFELSPTRNYSASVSTGGVFNLNMGNGANTSAAGLVVYSNIDATAAGRLAVLTADNPAFDQQVFRVTNDGVASAISAECTNTTRNTGGECVNITDVAGANRTTLGVTGAPIGLGLLKFTVSSGADASASALSVAINDADPQGFFVDTIAGYTGKFFNIRNNGTEMFTLTSDGNLTTYGNFKASTTDFTISSTGTTTIDTNVTGVGHDFTDGTHGMRIIPGATTTLEFY